jgi:hypothetical protein
MSLALAAKHLASTGRNNDTELVHMSKQEVASLNQLAQQHGIKLTRNPTTGLVEAGGLDSLLPTIAGFGISALSGGMIDPITAGMIVGGGTTILSGGDLQKGLMAGLGAYGGAGMGAGLMGSGAESLAGSIPALEQGISAAPTAIEAAAPAASTATGFGGVGTDAAIMGNPVLPSQATGFGGIGTDAAVGRNGLSALAAQTTPQAIQETAIQNAMTNAPTQASQQVLEGAQRGAYLPSDPSSQYALNAQNWAGNYTDALQNRSGESMLQGFKNLGSPGGLSNATAYMGGNMGALKYLGAGLTPYIMDANSQNVPGHTSASDFQNTVRPYKFSQYHDPNAPINSRTPYFTQTMTALPTYVAPYAEGGATKSRVSVNAMGGSGDDMSQAAGNINYQTPIDEATMLRLALAGHLAQGKNWQNNGVDSRSIGLSHRLSPNSSIEGMLESSAHPLQGREPINRAGVTYNRNFAAGGISNLGSYSDGGQLLRGPGDGVSDDIPAQIGEHQPARLAEGEFVVPARIVSELGNGSTNAGAKRLYDMMNRIQAGRSKTMGGKTAYAKNTNAARHLPA